MGLGLGDLGDVCFRAFDRVQAVCQDVKSELVIFAGFGADCCKVSRDMCIFVGACTLGDINRLVLWSVVWCGVLELAEIEFGFPGCSGARRRDRHFGVSGCETRQGCLIILNPDIAQKVNIRLLI